MIQSRASFVAAALIGVLLFLWTIIRYTNSRNFKEFFPNIFYAVPFSLAILMNQIFISDRGADALSRAATISLSTNDGSVNQRLRYYEDVLNHLNLIDF